MCCRLVERRFPAARKSLCSQLAASICVRATSLQYLQRHNQKLAVDRQEATQLTDIPENESLHATETEGLGQSNLREQGPKNQALPSDTLPSGVPPSDLSRAWGRINAPSSSVESRGLSTRYDEFRYPPKPEGGGNGKYAPCGICGDPNLSAITETEWE